MKTNFHKSVPLTTQALETWRPCTDVQKLDKLGTWWLDTNKVKKSVSKGAGTRASMPTSHIKHRRRNVSPRDG
jgi:hypothetical protein